jgi:hypothetical protein
MGVRFGDDCAVRIFRKYQFRKPEESARLGAHGLLSRLK